MKKTLLLLYIVLLCTIVSHAQRVSRDFRNVTMPAALQQLGGTTHRYTINFIYNELDKQNTEGLFYRNDIGSKANK